MTSGYFASRKKIHLKEHYLSPAIKSFLCPSAARAPRTTRPLCSCSGFPLVPAAPLVTKTAKLRTQPFFLSGSLSVFKSRDPRKSLKDFCDVVKPDPLLSYLLGSHYSRTGTFSSHRHLRVAFPEAPSEQAHQNLENLRSLSLPVHDLLKMREEAIHR